MSKTTNKYSLEVRERAVRMVLNGERQHESRWSAILSISSTARQGFAQQIPREEDWLCAANAERVGQEGRG